MEEKKKKKILILSGGGIRGLAYCGSFAALSKLGILEGIETFVGTSVGSLFALFHIIGYKHNDILRFAKLFDFNNLRNINVMNLMSSYGIDNGSKLKKILDTFVKKKGYNENITLRELYEKTKKTLIITTVCVNDACVKYISHETHPDLSAIMAVQMSIAIPIYFYPIFYENKYYVDAGFADNYPIKLFDDKIDSVIGLYLEDNNCNSCDDIQYFDTYLLMLYYSTMKAMTRYSIHGYSENTIIINTDISHCLNFDISNDKLYDMWEEGYNSVIKFFDNTN